MSYYDNYFKRLNQDGRDYQSRIQKKRERVFEDLLTKSLYRVDFEYGGEMHPGCFERYKQDETETFHYLLTRVHLDMPNGTILMIPNKEGIERPYMIFWLEHINASGYNRYIMLRMSHYIKWKARDGKMYASWAYFYGQKNNMLKDEIQARSRSHARYTENLKLEFFIMPRNEHIKKDDYLVIGEGTPFEQGYVVTGYDLDSGASWDFDEYSGVEYVSVDPVYLRDKSEKPEKKETDNSDDYFWMEGGN